MDSITKRNNQNLSQRILIKYLWLDLKDEIDRSKLSLPLRVQVMDFMDSLSKVEKG